jgi:hypothetical protein
VRWGSVPEGEYAEVRVNAAVTRASQTTYANAAVVSFDGRDNPVDSSVIRTDASGTGTGQEPPSTTSSPTTTSTTSSPTSPQPSVTAWTEPPYTTEPPTGGTGTSGGPGVLAYTGSDVAAAGVAMLLLFVGAGLVVATRRRGSHGGW